MACAGAPPGVVQGGTAPAERQLKPGCPGSQWSTIQDAIDASIPGDVIVVCAGTWNETLVINGKQLTLRSQSGAASTVVDASGQGIALKVRDGSDVVVQGLTLRNGRGSGIGGDLSCDRSNIVLRDSVLETGHADQGGGFGTTSCTGRIENTTFRANTAADYGGGLYVRDGISLVGNRFEHNLSDDQGGGGYVDGSYATIRGNTFVHNVSDDDGGGLSVYQGLPLVDGNTFEENDAGGEGGGLRVKSSQAVITNNVLRNNHAGYRGGGSKISHHAVTMSGNVFDGNVAERSGGALLLYESASMLTNETYTNNRAERGGGVVVVEGWGDVVFEDARFENNEAREDGGHLYVDLGAYETVLRRGVLVGGVAQRGGAIAAESGAGHETDEEDEVNPGATVLRLENTLLKGNLADDEGGALWLVGVTGDVTNSLVVDNEAPDGAGLFSDAGEPLAIRNTVWTANHDGAAVHVESGDAPDFGHDVFHANDQDFEGLSSCIGEVGNLAVEPSFVDPVLGDYHLAAGSPLVDAGDPALLDPDGSRSDIGLYGGPVAVP